MFAALHTVHVTELLAFVAFDAAAAKAYADAQDNEHQCCVSEVEELPLVDNYGFCCDRSEAGVLFPWIAHVDPSVAHNMLTLPFYMTASERDRFELAEDIAYWQARAQ